MQANGGTLLANYNTVSTTASSTGTGAVTVGAPGTLGGAERILGVVSVAASGTPTGTPNGPAALAGRSNIGSQD